MLGLFSRFGVPVIRCFAILVIAWLTAACSPMYVIRAGLAEARILSRRQPITAVIADPRTDAQTRARLEVVQQARTFAEKELGLNAGESFTTYSWVESDTLLMVVSASRKDRFQAHTWWFPIVGHVPYKGYFDFPRAFAEAEELERKGYDAHVRPSGAFSTLGWFNDPVLNTVLRYGDVSLANTVIHELLHNTLFVPSHVSFNESFANFVGDRGAIDFFCTRDGAESRNCQLAEGVWADNLLFGRFMNDLVARLDAVYQRPDLSTEEKIRQREPVFSEARERFARDIRPALRTTSFNHFENQPLNNATLIGTRLYYDRLDLFEAAYERNGRDLRRTIEWIRQTATARDADPFLQLSNALKNVD